MKRWFVAQEHHVADADRAYPSCDDGGFERRQTCTGDTRTMNHPTVRVCSSNMYLGTNVPIMLNLIIRDSDSAVHVYVYGTLDRDTSNDVRYDHDCAADGVAWYAP